MYKRIGFGLYAVELKVSGEPIGMCGLIRRGTLPDVDIGFAPRDATLPVYVSSA